MKNLKNEIHEDLYDQIEKKDEKSSIIRQTFNPTICKVCKKNSMVVKLKQNSVIWKCKTENCSYSFEEILEK